VSSEAGFGIGLSVAAFILQCLADVLPMELVQRRLSGRDCLTQGIEDVVQGVTSRRRAGSRDEPAPTGSRITSFFLTTHSFWNPSALFLLSSDLTDLEYLQLDYERTSMTPEYKAEKEASVSFLGGGGIWEINHVTLVAPVRSAALQLAATC